MRRQPLFVIALGLGGGGCVADFDPSSYLNSVRVLAVKAEPPEIATGETTTLTAASFGLTSPLEWTLCTRGPTPGGVDPINTDCVKTDVADFLIPIGTGDEVKFTLGAVAPTEIGLPDASTGVYVTIRIAAHGLDPDGNDRTIYGAYRLRYHDARDPRCKNQNPKLAAVFAVPGDYTFPLHDDGSVPQGSGLGMCAGPLDAGSVQLPDASPSNSFVPFGEDMKLPVPAGQTVRLAAAFAAGSDESYSVLTGDPNDLNIMQERERLTLFWYANAGTFSRDTTGLDQPDTDLTLEKSVTPGVPFDVWIVGRDERGGTDFTHRTILPQ